MTRRVLVVADVFPWPADDGYRLRTSHLVRGMADAGAVTLVAADGARVASTAAAPTEVDVRVVRYGADIGPRAWVGRWVAGVGGRGLPRRMLKGRLDPLRNAIDEIVCSQRFDVVWFEHVDTWAATHDLVAAHQPHALTICDFDNLENLLLSGRRSVGPVWLRSPHRGVGATARSALGNVAIGARWVLSRLFDADDARRFDHLQRRIGAAVDRVVVCSPVDVGRSGCPNAVCVPNGYESDGVVAAERSGPGDPPTFVFVGLMSYQPNEDAARWFATDVFPIVRAETGAELRIVGRRPDAVADLDRLDGVSVVGEVPSTAAELDRSDIAVIPIRFGGGTRLKAVEAMANHRPIVSTTIGVEGLDLVAGESVEIGDDVESLAAACRRLLEPAHWCAVAQAAHAVYEERYEWVSIRRRVTELALGSEPGG